MEEDVIYVSHPLIKDKSLEERSYQGEIVRACLRAPTLVVLATGLGKTAIAARVIAERLHKYPNTRALFMAPTRPLVEQHKMFLRRVMKIDLDKIVSLSGHISPEDRTSIWSRAKIVVATPQVVLNDLEREIVPLESYSVLVFDEAHRAVGDYPYVRIAKKYWEIAWYPLVLGLTASPGNRIEDLIEICTNLGVYNIEFKSETDPEVRKYLFEKEIKIIRVKMPQKALIARKLLVDALGTILSILKSMKIISSESPNRVSIRELTEKMEMISEAEVDQSTKSRALMYIGMALKLHHAIEVLDRHGPGFAREYLREAIFKKGTRTSAVLTNDERILLAYNMLKDLGNPKVEKVVEIVDDALNKRGVPKIIVFVEYRDVAKQLEDLINQKVPNAKARIFIGQGLRKGVMMSQKEQISVIESFRRGEYNVLVATSVAEEGLDIPETDLIIFYEAIPSKVRTIQRKGRTGRHRKGEIVILVSYTETGTTRDQIYFYVTSGAEKKIKEMIRRAIPKIKEKNRKIFTEFLERNGLIFQKKRMTRGKVTLFDLYEGFGDDS